MTVEQVIQKSSNVGTVQMALKMSPKDMWETFAAIGLGQAPQLGFPGAVAGRLRPHRNWKQIAQAVMSYGHGLSVSLMQLARAYLVEAMGHAAAGRQNFVANTVDSQVFGAILNDDCSLAVETPVTSGCDPAAREVT